MSRAELPKCETRSLPPEILHLIGIALEVCLRSQTLAALRLAGVFSWNLLPTHQARSA
jgi:hypothetical protein